MPKSEQRQNKIYSVLKARQYSLQVVLENIHDPHNVSAIFRTCDAVGIPETALIYNEEKFPKIGRKTSASAFKWVDKIKYESVDECYFDLHAKGFKIYASEISKDAVSLYDIDLTEKTAIVFGNEHRGVSEEAAKKADKKFLIPMYGMVQSLNVSVAAAVVLYEALRQRLIKNKYSDPEISESVFKELIEKWNKK